jgi:hypothetical protein
MSKRLFIDNLEITKSIKGLKVFIFQERIYCEFLQILVSFNIKFQITQIRFIYIQMVTSEAVGL